ncbi:hypothetical protein GW814_00275, partial [Candidatus Falkowbacteria bacterium]|nr:hypothetical protein [Candidatus Falkowbacteria bacterium]
ELAVYLVKENLGKIRAEELARELKEKIFSFLDAQTPAAKGASFFFSADDEAEIRELAK